MANILVITGGSRGIGKETIKKFLADGWQAVNLSRTPVSLPQVTNVAVDLTATSSLPSIANDLKVALQGANKICLVHNAAYYQLDAIPTLALADLQQTLSVNLISPVALTQMVLPYMQPQSAIIYIGSTLGEKAVPGSASYIISKHALTGLMRATCQDLISTGIMTCCINPGLVDTKLLKDTINQDTIEFLLQNTVIGKRLLEPEEIANIIYFCAQTPALNGAIIPANLGQVA